MSSPHQPDHLEPAGADLSDRAHFFEVLQRYKSQSSFSYKELGRRVDRPASTVNGWVLGRHLPYQRENEAFAQVLSLLEVGDISEWMEALATLRDQNADAFVNPYQGLDPYTEEDSRYYFGREGILSDALQTVDSAIRTDSDKPVLILGASGAGKSSLLQAGIAAALKQRPDCYVTYTTPGTDPLGTVHRALHEQGNRAGENAATVLILDQFEELFSEDNSQLLPRLVEELAAANATPNTQILIGLRSDFFQHASASPYILEGLRSSQILVDSISRDEVSSCITGPARAVNLAVAPELLSRLLQEFDERATGKGSAETLPLLSHVLYAIAKGSNGGALTLEGYQAVGGLGHALERSAEEALMALTSADQGACRELFTRLVTLDGIDASPTRRPAELADFEDLGDASGLSFQSTIDRFTQARLLTIGDDSIQISHEALLSSWPRLVKWLDGERELLMTIRQVGNACSVWVDADEDPHALLRGTQLDRAVLLAQNPKSAVRLTKTQRRFIATATEREIERAATAARRKRGLQVLVAVATVAAVAAGLLAFQTNRASIRADQAKAVALSRQLALQSSVLRGTDPSLSAQLGLVALASATTMEARSAVTDATALPASARHLGGPGPTALATASDGSIVAYTNSVDGTIILLGHEADSLVRLAVLDLADSETDIYAVALSPDGRLLAAGGTDNQVTLWDLENVGNPRILDSGLTNFTEPIQSIRFDSTGTRIFASGTGDGIGIWNVGTGPIAELGGLIPSSGSTMSFSLDTSDEMLASASLDGTVSLWLMSEQDAPIWSVPSNDDTVASTVALSPSGHLVAAGYRNGTVRIWDTSDPFNPKELPLGSTPFASWTNWVEFSPDGSRLAAGGGDGSLRLWKTDTWQQEGADLMHSTLVTSVRFRGNDSIVAALADGSIRIRDLTHPSLETLQASIWSTTFDADGRTVLSTSGASSAIWDVVGNRLSRREQDLLTPDSDIAFSGSSSLSPDGQHAAIGSRTGPVLLVNLDDQDVAPQRLLGLTNLVEFLTFSVNGKLLAGADDDGRSQLWTIDDDRVATAAGVAIVQGFAMNLAMSPSADFLIVMSDDGLAHLFDISNPAEPIERSTFTTGKSLALSAGFHPSLPVVATGNADGTVTLWDYSNPDDPRSIAALSGANSRVFSLAFNRDGSRLAAAVGDGTAWVWNTSVVAETVLSAVLSAANGSLFTISFSPDSSLLIGAGADQHLFVWHLDPETLIDAVCSGVGDKITKEEWRIYVPDEPYAPPCA